MDKKYNIKQFLEDTINQWVKIETIDMNIIQFVTKYKPLNSKSNIFECDGYSISVIEEWEIKELDNFYISSSDLDGQITILTSEDAEKEIDKIKNKS